MMNLKSLNWFPHNHKILSHFIDNIKAHTVEKKCAAFDWDNTCIFNDIGEAVFRYQVKNVDFKLNPKEFAGLIPYEVIGYNESINPSFTLLDIKNDLEEDYEKLYDFKNKGLLDRAYNSNEYLSFRVKLNYLYNTLLNSNPTTKKWAYHWVIRFLKGFLEDEIEALSKSIFQEELKKPIKEITLKAPPGKKIENISISWIEGIRIHPEIIDLMRAFRERDIMVYVITASHESVVRAVSSLSGYNIQGMNVFGMRLIKENNIFTAQPFSEEEHPISFGEGKVDMIKKYLPDEPIFVAGDTDTDIEMLTHLSKTELRLILNRKPSGKMKGLHKKAFTDENNYLLQGRNENTGSFHPYRESIYF